MEHYFSKTPISDYNENIIESTISGLKLHFYSGSGVFSRIGIDFGSRLLITAFYEDYSDDPSLLLDMGCGYGPIGIYAAAKFKEAHVEMVDINERAVELAMKNIESNGIRNAKARVSDGFIEITREYDVILTNPPIRAGKKIVFSFYQGAFEHLKSGGAFYCVIQKKQGAESSFKKLKELFGNCEVVSKKSGYRILKSVKS